MGYKRRSLCFKKLYQRKVWTVYFLDGLVSFLEFLEILQNLIRKASLFNYKFIHF